MKCYKCSHSGLLLPPDYVREWGKKYGHGLGAKPVSECLNTVDVVPHTKGIRYNQPASEWMLPVEQTCAPIEVTEVPYDTWDAVPPEKKMILSWDDPDRARALEIVRKKQEGNPVYTEFKAQINQTVTR